MRIAYLECFSGISGDMFLGALLDAGVSSGLFESTVAALDVGARLETSEVTRSGIRALKVDVYVNGEKDLPREEYWKQHTHEHEHEHAHAAGKRSHSHPHQPVQLLEHNYAPDVSARTGLTTAHGHGRGLREIREIIGKAAIPESTRQTAISIFEALGAAEARVHNSDIEAVHFHEVGAVDALVDIVCAAVGAEALGVDEFVCSPLNVGGGTVQCAHGTFPVPAPATLELLKGAPVYSSMIQAELVTPTGAAIVKILATRFASFPRMRVERSGYGAGTRDFPDHPNVVRLTVGEAQPEIAETSSQLVTMLEANLDDLNPQVFGYVMERLLNEGALDVFGVPVQMKKNRPGMLLTVLCAADQAGKLANLIFSETTTLGVRQREEHRRVLARKWVSVPTRWGDVRIKLASMNGAVTNFSPEYEDCRRIAAERHIPLKTVMQEAVQAYVRLSEAKEAE